LNHLRNLLKGTAALALPLLTATAAALSVPQPARALGHCPDGFVSIQGGYCRDIICIQSSYAKSDPTAIQAMKAEGASCEKGYSARWGDKVVKKSLRAMFGM
jgi:hypothetical protein